MTPAPISFRALPGASHIHSGREEVILLILLPLKHVKAESLATQSSLGYGKGPFLFFKQKKTIDPGFSLKEKEKA